MLGYNPDRDVLDLAGKVFLITSSTYIATPQSYHHQQTSLLGTAGLGKSTVVQLARHNPKHIYFTERNTWAAEAVIAEAIPASTNVSFVPCDLDSLSFVSQAANSFLKKSGNQLDVLICNAGLMAVPPGIPKDGYEIQFAVNNLAHALLMMLCLPALQKTVHEKGDPRIISLTSLGFRSVFKAGIMFKDLKSSQENLRTLYVRVQPRT